MVSCARPRVMGLTELGEIKQKLTLKRKRMTRPSPRGLLRRLRRRSPAIPR